MNSLWSDSEAASFSGDLPMRVYTSRLQGRNPELVLHGGGNTSVKIRETDFFGEETDLLYVKGSGWDLEKIEPQGFAPVRMNALLKMAEMPELGDADMVKHQRAAMLDPDAPTPSIEAILHAVIPSKYVDHTHANAILALTNHPDGEARVREVYGDRIIIVPYVMPGFILARTIYDLIKDRDLRAEGIDGLVLLNHGIFTFNDDAKLSYELMIELVSLAENFLTTKAGGDGRAEGESTLELLQLAELRQAVSKQRGCASIVKLDTGSAAAGFSARADIDQIATRGPVTPDHSIRTKRIPAIIGDDISGDIQSYADDYAAYFERNAKGETMLDQSPRWAVWKGRGVAAFGATEKEANVVRDIAQTSWETIQLAEATGGWQALSEKDIFEIEYWDLEQAKLKKGGSAPVHQGKIAIVTGSAGGIGLACAASLVEQGAKVVGFDLHPDIESIMEGIGAVGKVVNLTDDEKVVEAINWTVREYGGLDIVVSNAGIFTAGQYLDELEQSNWDKSLAVNLTAAQKLLKYTYPYLKKGIDAAVVIVGSRNVQAPGPGAASYSCAKAALTQLCRVASMELAPEGVRCNIIHPDAVFDTALWTPEALARSAERYDMTIEEYKTRNLMKTEIKSADVGRMVSARASPIFGNTTGAQLPFDGGNDRVI
ncbi:MAG: rhamnose utilization protein RhaD (predicted bifunctional aldolase and dehydrogenase) [Verrucomicrobiales bacterium]|jgi:rhamnose utilization protein RhaD (predicted bifunctional aldolase and dehydrogenase)/NAD(P)-dependent dehydrogenase (short-subunit alcohol dehydrogenase family)